MPTVEESIGSWLVQLGITHVYGIGAVPMHETFRHCANAGLVLVATREQRAAVLMASCHNYLAGEQVACTIVSMGPSAANAITGALVAKGNQWPVMIIGNTPARDAFFAGSFQSFDAVSTMERATKLATQINKREDCQRTLSTAYTTANFGPRGPVYVDFTTTILTQSATSHPVSGAAAPVEEYADECLAELAHAISSAKRPLMLLGQNIRWNDDYLIMQWMAERYDLVFTTVPMSRGFLSETHPHCVTRNSTEAQAESDLVIVIGGALDWKFRFGVAINPAAKIFQVGADPLSPAFHRDVKIVESSVIRLKTAFEAHEALSSNTRRDKNWIQAMHQRHKEFLAHALEIGHTSNGTINSYFIAMSASRVVCPTTLFILDANVTMRASDLVLNPELPLTHLTAGHTGLMGGGIPYGIAALIEDASRSVIVICGDFALGQSAMELETAARLNLPLVVLLANNGAGSGGVYEFPEYSSSFTKFYAESDYKLLARAFGGEGKSVEDAHVLPAAINEAIETAQLQKKPYLLDIRITDTSGMPPRL